MLLLIEDTDADCVNSIYRVRDNIYIVWWAGVYV